MKIETIDKIMAFDWEKIIGSVVRGLQRFLERVQYYWPKTSKGFENEDSYKVD